MSPLLMYKLYWRKLHIIVITSQLVLLCKFSDAQTADINREISGTKQYLISNDSTIILLGFERHNCKAFLNSFEKFIRYNNEVVKPNFVGQSESRKSKFLTVHGNVSYDYFYRSKIDTPIQQQNFQQHTEAVYLDILIKEKYPLKVNLTSRQSNSPYFRNFLDVNFNFDRSAYTRNLKQRLLEKLHSQTHPSSLKDLSIEKESLKKYQDAFNSAKSWIEAPSTLQKLVEERENIYLENLNKSRLNTSNRGIDTAHYAILPDSIQNRNLFPENSKFKFSRSGFSDLTRFNSPKIPSTKDSATSLVNTYYEQINALDSLAKKIAIQKNKVDSINSIVQKDINGIRQKIYSASSGRELAAIAEKNGIRTDEISKFEKMLSSVRSFSIGRSMLNYTELTAQNITVSGINIEYNPSYYAAFAAGKIDYRFRDFYGQKSRQRNQYIIMGRLGFGNINRRAVIFSYFTGKKDNNYGIADSMKNSASLLGFSVETILKKDENTFLSAEFARSTRPLIGNLQARKQSGGLLKFTDPSNMGINLKAQTVIPETQTSISGFFRKSGENFQSFSLFSYNSDQTAWLARVDQSLLKKKITLTGMLRRNDFTNPFTEKTYKTSTVFKTLQLNIRLRKLPTLSLGYFPGTQLYVVDKETIRESSYYIVNGSSSYSYAIKGLQMNSMIVYNKYTSEATDSGFVAYKGINVYASQAVRFSKLQVQAGYAFTKLSELTYTTAEITTDYGVKHWLQLGVGLKYNKVRSGEAYIGEYIQARTDFKKLGGLLLQYEKSFLPTLNRKLSPAEIGRLTYYRRF